ncbi:MAG: amino acid permease, partial [Bacteroidia bacterium]
MQIKTLFRRKSITTILRDAEIGLGDGETHGELKRTLTLRDLTAFGIAAVIGAGIFSTIGNAAAAGGPAVSLLFIFTAVACAFSALCYAEFASMIPVSGSAYTYSYVAFGEIIAWIIGWDLILEYAVGNIAVAISWSDYFTGLMDGLGMHIPEYLTMDFLSAMRGSEQVEALLAKGVSYADIPGNLILAHKAWQLAPQIGNFHFVADVPALAIVFFITYLVYIGIKKSRNVSNILVVLKLLVIVMVIVVGFFYINPANWNPFAPNGISRILKGVAAVFFAYIGFDAISTTAEETKNP